MERVHRPVRLVAAGDRGADLVREGVASRGHSGLPGPPRLVRLPWHCQLPFGLVRLWDLCLRNERGIVTFTKPEPDLHQYPRQHHHFQAALHIDFFL